MADFCYSSEPVYFTQACEGRIQSPLGSVKTRCETAGQPRATKYKKAATQRSKHSKGGKQTEKKRERHRKKNRVQQQAVRVSPDSRIQFAELEKERKQSRGKHQLLRPKSSDRVQRKKKTAHQRPQQQLRTGESKRGSKTEQDTEQETERERAHNQSEKAEKKQTDRVTESA